MKRGIYLFTLAIAVLLGFALAIGSTIGQAFISGGVAAATGFIQPLTAPNSASFSQVNFNTGSGVTTTQNNNSTPVTSITLTQNDPNGTFQIAGLTKAKINALFTVTVGCSTGTPIPSFIAGLWLTDGSAHNIIMGIDSGGSNGYNVAHYSDFTGTFGNSIFATNSWPYGPLLWFRVQETVSARNFYVSSDGINFQQVASIGNTTYFTTTQYGFAADNRAGGNGYGSLTCYSFTETTP